MLSILIMVYELHAKLRRLGVFVRRVGIQEGLHQENH